MCAGKYISLISVKLCTNLRDFHALCVQLTQDVRVFWQARGSALSVAFEPGFVSRSELMLPFSLAA